jgi:diadenylate cyclase
VSLRISTLEPYGLPRRLRFVSDIGYIRVESAGGRRVTEIFRLFRWQDGLDILILTFVFYRLFLWLKRKRALRMILGVLSLPIYYVIARWVDLPLSVWGFQNLWPVIILVLVVIFQQEIREVLGSITLPTFLFGRPDSEVHGSDVLTRIVEASFRMINKKTGGLIVLERNDNLDEFIHGQTELDAAVNEDLVISIFNPESPLHDGAIVIRGNRIRYATALLPVSQSPSLPKEWGTRHRAGLGISEVSDAECIIISEERQEVLLVSDGIVERKAQTQDLLKSLSAPASRPWEAAQKEKKPHWILKDLPAKALFLLVVCLLWVVVIGLRQGETSFNVPVEYYSARPNLGIAGAPPREVNVRLRGSQRLLASIEPDRLRVHVDLMEAHVGTNQISLSAKDIDIPSGVSVIEFKPRKLTVQLSPLQR